MNAGQIIKGELDQFRMFASSAPRCWLRPSRTRGEQLFEFGRVLHGPPFNIIIEVNINPGEFRAPTADSPCPFPQCLIRIRAPVLGLTWAMKANVSEVGCDLQRDFHSAEVMNTKCRVMLPQ